MVGERLSRHPVWPATLDFLATAGITLLDPVTGQLTQTPSGIASGTGDAVADAFDPHLLLRLADPRRPRPSPPTDVVLAPGVAAHPCG